MICQIVAMIIAAFTAKISLVILFQPLTTIRIEKDKDTLVISLKIRYD